MNIAKSFQSYVKSTSFGIGQSLLNKECEHKSLTEKIEDLMSKTISEKP